MLWDTRMKILYCPPPRHQYSDIFYTTSELVLTSCRNKNRKNSSLCMSTFSYNQKKDISVPINYLYTNMQQKLRNMDTLTIQISVIMCASRYINTALMLIIIHFIKSKSGNRMLNFSTLISNLFHDIQCYLTCRPA